MKPCTGSGDELRGFHDSHARPAGWRRTAGGFAGQGVVGRGWRVTVVALTGGGGDAARDLSSAGAGLMTLGMRKGLLDPRGWVRIHQWLRSQRPDVVHAHLPHCCLDGALVSSGCAHPSRSSTPSTHPRPERSAGVSGIAGAVGCPIASLWSAKALSHNPLKQQAFEPYQNEVIDTACEKSKT